MTREDILACLKDRPCNVCKFRFDDGCHKWECVFEQEPDDADSVITIETINQYCKEHNYFLYEKGTEKKILEDIKAEIEAEKESMIQHNGTSDLGLALEIIDKHIGKEQE